MSTVIESLKVENFEGYKEEDFQFSPGLNVIIGRNSTGKSTILDALSYALFGEAPDGVEKRLLVSKLPGRGNIGAYVRFRGPKTTQVVEVRRTGKLDPKGGYRRENLQLKIDGKEITLQDDDAYRAIIAEQLGVSFRQFMNLVYVRQGRLTSILEPKQEQMDSILNIDLLRELQEQFDETRKQLAKYEENDAQTVIDQLVDVIIPQHKRLLDGLAEEIPTINKEVNLIKEKIEKGVSEELKTLLELIETKRRIDQKLRESDVMIRQSLEGIGAKTLDEVKKQQIDCEDQHRILEEELTQKNLLKQKIPIVSTLATSLLSLSLSIMAMIGWMPSTFLTAIPILLIIYVLIIYRQLQADKTKVAIKTKVELSAQTLNNTAKKISEYQTCQSKATQSLENNLEAQGGILNELNIELDPKDQLFERNLASQIPITTTELVKTRDELKQKTDRLEIKKETRKKISEKKAEDEKKLEKLKVQIRKASLARKLSEGFEQAVEERRGNRLKRIELRALQNYKSMTDQHSYSAIYVNPENYRVQVSPKGLTDRIPATRTGGGHQTLISLALRLALLQELNFRSLLLLDEPTYGVDDQNLPQLASQLGETARQLSQTIIVTHHGICEEYATNTLKIIVGHDGASQIQRES